MKQWLYHENLDGNDWKEEHDKKKNFGYFARLYDTRPDYASDDDDPVVFKHRREYDRQGDLLLRKPINIVEAWANRPRAVPTDTFMMDTENWILQKWDSRKGIPQGPARYKNSDWAELVQKHCFPHGDLYWHEYVAWCESGGGDEWFQEELPESLVLCLKPLRV